MSTQATAWSLYAICDYARTLAGNNIAGSVRAAGKTWKMTSDKALVRQDIPLEAQTGSFPLSLSNTGGNPVHAIISVTGIPAAGAEQAKASGLKMQVRYTDPEGKAIAVDTLSRGRSFNAIVTITNTGSAAVQNLALAQKFPSGWEIQNDRICIVTVDKGIHIAYGIDEHLTSDMVFTGILLKVRIYPVVDMNRYTIESKPCPCIERIIDPVVILFLQNTYHTFIICGECRDVGYGIGRKIRQP